MTRIASLLLLLACSVGPDQPADLAYDRIACDHCGMIVGDPRFAAQITTKDGQRYAFDDPACAFAFIAEQGPDLAHVWFHDGGERWIPWQEVGFVEAKGTPMDGGLAAVFLAEEPGALSFSEASSRVLGGKP
jgi:copper chaperone NosL